MMKMKMTLNTEHFNLGVEFRQFVIEYNINHKLIKKSTINTFLKQKPFTYILKEKPNDLKKNKQITMHRQLII